MEAFRFRFSSPPALVGAVRGHLHLPIAYHTFQATTSAVQALPLKRKIADDDSHLMDTMMHYFSQSLVIRGILSCGCLLACGLPAMAEDLFNGKDLAGWHADIPAKDDNPDVKPSFIVRDGMLVSLGTPQGHLITDASHQNYRLVVEYRFAGKPGNCGVLVHASTPRALYKMFPKSIEVQMNHQHAGDFWCIVQDITVPDMLKRRGPEENWGITEGKGRRILNLTDGSEKPVGQWNAMVIECLEDQVKVWVNGDLVNHGTKCTAVKGQIAVQAEGAEVEFRKLDITPITKLSADDKF